MFNRLLLLLKKPKKQQVFYFLHQFKNEKKKIKYKDENEILIENNKNQNQNKNKSFKKNKTTKSVNTNKTNCNNSNTNNHILSTKLQTNGRTVIMLNNLETDSMQGDHMLEDVVTFRQIGNVNQHCASIDPYYSGRHLMSKQRKVSEQNTNARTRTRKRRCAKYLKNSSSYCSENINNQFKSGNFKRLSDYVRHICFYFQKNYNNFQIIIVIFLLALITTTAKSLETQEKPIQKVNSTSLLPSSFDVAATVASVALPFASSAMPSTMSDLSLYMSPCRSHLYGPTRADDHNDNSIKFKRRNCSNLRHLNNYNYHHHHHHHHRHHQPNRRKILKNLLKMKKYEKIKNKKWPSANDGQKVLTINKKQQIRNNSTNHKYYNKHNQQHKQDDDDDDDDDETNTNNIMNSSSFNARITTSDEHMNRNLTKGVQKTSVADLNINIKLQHSSKDDGEGSNNDQKKNNNISSNNNNDTLPVNMMMMHTTDEDDTSGSSSSIDRNKKNTYSDDDNAASAEVNKSHFSVDFLLPPVTTTTISGSSSSTTTTLKQTNLENPFQITSDSHHHYPHYTNQQIDNFKLMKLVMDGLGLQKLPDMKTVNISQQEYSNKYREYLQRVHSRKRRELRNDHHGLFDDEYNLKPLQIWSIVTNSTVVSHDDYEDSKDTIRKRHKREMIQGPTEGQDIDNKNNEDEDNDEPMEDLDKQIKNILFLRKKHQKPRSTKKQRDERKTNIRLMFSLKQEALSLSSDDVEEANIRLVLIHSPTLAIRNSHRSGSKIAKHKQNNCGSSKSDGEKSTRLVNVLNLKLFFITKTGKRTWLDGRKVDLHTDLSKPDETHTQWLQFDVTKAVKATIEENRLHHVTLELQCENCKRIGARILNDAHNTVADAQADDPTSEGYQLMPVLNIIGRFGQSPHTMRPHKYDTTVHANSREEHTTQRQYSHQVNGQNNKNRHNRRTNCYKANQRCCRHAMEVTFKEIKGFEFIIQPKVFDAGYCHGRCPPRYNPAHHHAMLQSLIWKKDHQKAPRPCCAPSKLVELEVLHVDEKDSEKLKISTWSDMKVVECACS